ncbi:MAG TPA: hypothetical protein VJT67_15165 [Longimicrobiaceae bacterium]|nr:hypothetical protein [Longimicrobiaceae bacterium]
MDLRDMLDAVLASESDHPTRLAKSAAIISEALRREGLEATIVGGSAIELHAPDAYMTRDLDLVVAERFGIDWKAAVEQAFRGLGFARKDRHWTRDDLYVEIPSRVLSDPVIVMHVEPFPLRVVAKEVVLADRIVGYKYWRVTDYARQAMRMLAAFGPDLDEATLRKNLSREQAEDAFEVLRRLYESGVPITDQQLDDELKTIRPRGA